MDEDGENSVVVAFVRKCLVSLIKLFYTSNLFISGEKLDLSSRDNTLKAEKNVESWGIPETHCVYVTIRK